MALSLAMVRPLFSYLNRRNRLRQRMKLSEVVDIVIYVCLVSSMIELLGCTSSIATFLMGSLFSREGGTERMLEGWLSYLGHLPIKRVNKGIFGWELERDGETRQPPALGALFQNLKCQIPSLMRARVGTASHGDIGGVADGGRADDPGSGAAERAGQAGGLKPRVGEEVEDAGDHDCCEDEAAEGVAGATDEMLQVGAERTKNVLILMSDTDSGHRASAEAIRDAFRIEFGDE
ncbi:hypothetical protein Taro_055779 [Colocasia esculenta]|uniref:Monogalactosyldiacylglycerol synthase n=1 Tax=Colocasia esculenta TaxID=4460 RepID=A0A843XUA7_COLES|nr:hypothetical protein [Colocasia esculenta]